MSGWKSAPYPPWWISRAATRRRELAAAVERLRAVVANDADIVGALVFGSYATGAIGPQSDLDVMLVTTLPAGDDPAVARLASRDGFRSAFRAICLCTESMNSQLSCANDRSSLRPGVKAAGSVQQHPRELAGNWLEQARRDLDAAHYLFDGARYDAACFSAQQVAEKALRAGLIWLAGDRPRTHQLAALIEEVASHRGDAVEPLVDRTRSAAASRARHSSLRMVRSRSRALHAPSRTLPR